MKIKKAWVAIFHIVIIVFGVYVMWLNSTPIYRNPQHEDVPNEFLLVDKTKVYSTQEGEWFWLLFIHNHKLAGVRVNATIFERYQIGEWIMKGDLK